MNKTIVRITILFALMICYMHSFAQSQIITGKVTDENQEPIPGVNVVVVNTQERYMGGTITNMDGNYTVNVPNPEYSLQFSFIGYKTVKKSVVDKWIINVALLVDSEIIDEVVITGTQLANDGLTGVALKDLASSVVRMDFKEVEDLPVASLDEALQGRLANVDIIGNSGEPGAGMSIRIRGTTSLNASSEPLIVLDGIPYDTNIDDDFDFTTANEEDYGSLIDIAPEDIRSIEVLKDAGATAVWGSRGGNGVIVITTKRGNRGKTVFSYTYKLTSRFEPEPMEMLNGGQFKTYIQEGLWNAVLTKGTGGSHQNVSLLRAGIPELTYNPSDTYFDEYNRDTDWLGLITQTAFGHNHNLSMRGGGEKARYRLSFGYLSDIGTTIGTSYERLNTRINIDYRLSKKMTFSSDFSITNGTKEGDYYINEKDKNKLVRSVAFRKLPNMSPWIIDDETGKPTDTYFSPDSYWQGKSTSGWYNPVAAVYGSGTKTNSVRIRTKLALRYNVTETLLYELSVALDKSNTKTNKFLPQYVTGVSWDNSNSNRASDGTSERYSVNTFNKLIYRPKIGINHKLTVLGSLVTYERSNLNYNGTVSGLGSVVITDPSSEGNVVTFGSGASANRTIGLLMNAHYMYNDKYIVSGSVRGDGNSRFGEAKRWGIFPTVALAYRISNETFMDNATWIDDLKIRGSFGMSGNPPTKSYAYYGKYSGSGDYIDWSAIKPSNIQLDNMKWENVVQSNIGLNFFGFKNRLELSFDIYQKTTHDMLFKDAVLPGTTGFSNVGYLNYGDMKNYGWEFAGNAYVVKKSDWKVSLNWNIARNRNEILELPENVSAESFTFGNGKYATRVITGNPLGSFYGFMSEGIYDNKLETIALGSDGNPVYGLNGDPKYMKAKDGYVFQPGDARYKDINFDGVIDEYDVVYLGNAMPVVTGGLGSRISYKGWSVGLFFHYRFGQKIVNKARMDTENMYNKNNQSKTVLSRWRKPGDGAHTDIPRALYGYGYNWLGSDRFVEDGSFLRLKQLSLTYKVPKPVLKKVGLSEMRLYVMGYDLITFTKYTGQDPEVGVGGRNRAAIGYDNAKSPRPKRFTFGVNVKF